MTDPDPDTPVDPFGATVAGVQALLPDAQFVDTLGVGQKAVTKAQVRVWLVELTGHVMLRLSRYVELSEVQQTVIVNMAADIAHNGAASYAEAARYPERTGKADTTYAAVLWARYTMMLNTLGGQLDEWLGDQANGGTAGGISGSFPCPQVRDYQGF